MNYKAAPQGGPMRGIATLTMGYPRGGMSSTTKEPVAYEHLKIETPFGVIWVHVGRDDKDRSCLTVDVAADGARYAGELPAYITKVTRSEPRHYLVARISRMKRMPRKKAS